MPVQRNLLARADHDYIAYRDLVRIYFLDLSIPFQIGAVRADIHQGGNGLPAAAHRITLKQFAYLIKQHYARGFIVLPQRQGAYRGQRHQKIFVKDLAARNVAHRPPQHVPAHNKVGDQKNQQPGHAFQWGQFCRQKQCTARQNAGQHLFLLFTHSRSLPAKPIYISSVQSGSTRRQISAA